MPLEAHGLAGVGHVEEDPRWPVSRSLEGNARETVTRSAAEHYTIVDVVVEVGSVAPRSAVQECDGGDRWFPLWERRLSHVARELPTAKSEGRSDWCFTLSERPCVWLPRLDSNQ